TGIKDIPYSIIEDRYDAIRQAVELADKGDTIIVMGKGDEKFMYGREGREPYRGDDVIAREVIHKYYFGEGDDRNE
ncbi:MAG: UDP-N-acetylmuramoyl-L-alanyl-D-glutamate--2,6-diaminopimelate ligase, partial [Solobacterium sp.]|nr:UDP-N-acetylmuramoyl-L-alanyl-D-glutamate--2,6-diaminopimelate ligase [Solobacterium sp.]